ncbi:MAG: flagellar biosynthetic protein FliP, partial [SAR324 cluster bacterium]|nr:flagellar biosynthetic protein FliP [SAR324 cluster bacterium]
MNRALLIKIVLGLTALIALAVHAQAQTAIPGINISLGRSDSPQDVATSLQIIILLTILTLAPAILIMTTSFTRIIIVLAFIRQALGTQQTPPNQILLGMALFLTFFVMEPVWSEVYNNAFTPFLDNRV